MPEGHHDEESEAHGHDEGEPDLLMYAEGQVPPVPFAGRCYRHWRSSLRQCGPIDQVDQAPDDVGDQDDHATHEKEEPDVIEYLLHHRYLLRVARWRFPRRPLLLAHGP